MLNRDDNIGCDAVALPRRNIFAPPVATSAPPVSQAGGVFGSAAKCAPADATDVYRSDAAGGTPARARTVARLAAVVATATAALVIAALAARGLYDPVHPSPTRRPLQTAPTPHRGELPRVARPTARGKARPRRAHRKRLRWHTRSSHAAARRASPSRHSPPRPAPAPAGPRAEPQGPASTVRPARVPPDSPPEFM